MEDSDSNLVTVAITKKTLIPICSVVSAILAVVFIIFDEGLFVMPFAAAAIVFGHLALSQIALSAEKLAGALALAGVIVGYCSFTSFLTLVAVAHRLSH